MPPISALPTVYGIANCSSVKKARQWLEGQGVAHTFHDFKKHGVPADCLATWAAAVGWEKLLNRQGSTWRKLDTATQAGAQDAASAIAVMQQHPSAIKRPVVQWPQGRVTVGFAPQEWGGLLSGASLAAPGKL